MSGQVKNEPGSPFEDDVSLSPPETKGEASGVKEEEDDFEDSLDLDVSGAESKVWLVRMPRFLMDRWKNVDELSGKDLGKVRIRNGSSSEPWKVKLCLNDSPENNDIPHEYDINLVKKVVDNTYVFTESDLPEYQKKKAMKQMSWSNVEEEEAPPPPPPGVASTSSSENRNGNRYTPYVKTIPKKTALVGKACHECIVTPSLRDRNYSKVVSQRKAQEAEASKAKVTFLNEIPGVNTASFGQNLRGHSSAFMRAQKKDPKSVEGKATRLPQNELLDLLFKLFEEYDYWGMKGLRERTKQPEAYLKEVLDTMAVLIKKGPYAMKYTLKPEFKQIKGMGGSLSEYMNKPADDSQNSTNNDSNQSNENSTNNENNQDNNDDEEDEDVEMETVF
ncbi:hypothetical protein TRICI_000003 [Trichomonascus ciferrii]|uniref:Transcription initiation factor IIF subunit beta n=1 Tax=Trichomonascus ciferrii TaxID=44093 RepID=A0A642VEN1_9ASCO|nr:hypothetical protein TRICI_000003 [Trichomonascus ciferrii]